MQKRRSFLANVDPKSINFEQVKRNLEDKINFINSYSGADYVQQPSSQQNSDSPLRDNQLSKNIENSAGTQNQKNINQQDIQRSNQANNSTSPVSLGNNRSLHNEDSKNVPLQNRYTEVSSDERSNNVDSFKRVATQESFNDKQNPQKPNLSSLTSPRVSQENSLNKKPIGLNKNLSSSVEDRIGDLKSVANAKNPSLSNLNSREGQLVKTPVAQPVGTFADSTASVRNPSDDLNKNPNKIGTLQNSKAQSELHQHQLRVDSLGSRNSFPEHVASQNPRRAELNSRSSHEDLPSKREQHTLQQNKPSHSTLQDRHFPVNIGSEQVSSPIRNSVSQPKYISRVQRQAQQEVQVSHRSAPENMGHSFQKSQSPDSRALTQRRHTSEIAGGSEAQNLQNRAMNGGALQGRSQGKIPRHQTNAGLLNKNSSNANSLHPMRADFNARGILPNNIPVGDLHSSRRVSPNISYNRDRVHEDSFQARPASIVPQNNFRRELNRNPEDPLSSREQSQMEQRRADSRPRPIDTLSEPQSRAIGELSSNLAGVVQANMRRADTPSQRFDLEPENRRTQRAEELFEGQQDRSYSFQAENMGSFLPTIEQQSDESAETIDFIHNRDQRLPISAQHDFHQEQPTDTLHSPSYVDTSVPINDLQNAGYSVPSSSVQPKPLQNASYDTQKGSNNIYPTEHVANSNYDTYVAQHGASYKDDANTWVKSDSLHNHTPVSSMFPLKPQAIGTNKIELDSSLDLGQTKSFNVTTMPDPKIKHMENALEEVKTELEKIKEEKFENKISTSVNNALHSVSKEIETVKATKADILNILDKKEQDNKYSALEKQMNDIKHNLQNLVTKKDTHVQNIHSISQKDDDKSLDILKTMEIVNNLQNKPNNNNNDSSFTTVIKDLMSYKFINSLMKEESSQSVVVDPVLSSIKEQIAELSTLKSSHIQEQKSSNNKALEDLASCVKDLGIQISNNTNPSSIQISPPANNDITGNDKLMSEVLNSIRDLSVSVREQSNNSLKEQIKKDYEHQSTIINNGNERLVSILEKLLQVHEKQVESISSINSKVSDALLAQDFTNKNLIESIKNSNTTDNTILAKLADVGISAREQNLELVNDIYSLLSEINHRNSILNDMCVDDIERRHENVINNEVLYEILDTVHHINQNGNMGVLLKLDTMLELFDSTVTSIIVLSNKIDKMDNEQIKNDLSHLIKVADSSIHAQDKYVEELRHLKQSLVEGVADRDVQKDMINALQQVKTSQEQFVNSLQNVENKTSTEDKILLGDIYTLLGEINHRNQILGELYEQERALIDHSNEKVDTLLEEMHNINDTLSSQGQKVDLQEIEKVNQAYTQFNKEENKKNLSFIKDQIDISNKQYIQNLGKAITSMKQEQEQEEKEAQLYNAISSVSLSQSELLKRVNSFIEDMEVKLSALEKGNPNKSENTNTFFTREPVRSLAKTVHHLHDNIEKTLPKSDKKKVDIIANMDYLQRSINKKLHDDK